MNLSSLQHATDEQKREAFKKKAKGVSGLENVGLGHLKIKNVNNQYIIWSFSTLYYFPFYCTQAFAQSSSLQFWVQQEISENKNIQYLDINLILMGNSNNIESSLN